MGVFSITFVASEGELRAAFPRWVEVADQPVERESRNPFTGEAITARDWQRARPLPNISEQSRSSEVDVMGALRKLPHVEWKWVDTVKLARLQQIVAGGELRSIVETLCRPALLPDGNDDELLVRLPPAFVQTIVVIGDVGPTAKEWASTEEFRLDRWKYDDAVEIIESLRSLAQRALRESKGMFDWVCV